jgi:hypothetical protein
MVFTALAVLPIMAFAQWERHFASPWHYDKNWSGFVGL